MHLVLNILQLSIVGILDKSVMLYIWLKRLQLSGVDIDLVRRVCFQSFALGIIDIISNIITIL